MSFEAQYRDADQDAAQGADAVQEHIAELSAPSGNGKLMQFIAAGIKDADDQGPLRSFDVGAMQRHIRTDPEQGIDGKMCRLADQKAQDICIDPGGQGRKQRNEQSALGVGRARCIAGEKEDRCHDQQRERPPAKRRHIFFQVSFLLPSAVHAAHARRHPDRLRPKRIKSACRR